MTYSSLALPLKYVTVGTHRASLPVWCSFGMAKLLASPLEPTGLACLCGAALIGQS